MIVLDNEGNSKNAAFIEVKEGDKDKLMECNGRRVNGRVLRINAAGNKPARK
jgi:hypothetical protein